MNSKLRLHPIEISLKELPPEGREFEFTHESGELTAALKDLIGSNPYSLKVHLTPMGNSYDLKGKLNTAMDLTCALCATDFKHPVSLNLYELIVIEKAFAKGDQMTRNNHAHEWEASGPDYIILESDSFNVAEYAHEAVGLAEPIRALCAPEKPEGCANPGDRPERDWLSYGQDEKARSALGANPFQVLEKIKLKS